MDARYLMHQIKCMASRQESHDLKRVVISPLVYFILYKHIKNVFKLGKYILFFYIKRYRFHIRIKSISLNQSLMI